MSTQKRLFTAMTPSFCSLTDTKQSLQYTIKTHLSGPPMPKFEANMIYIPPSPPSSMKQCNKSATVKFHMELLLTTTTRKQSRSGATPSSGLKMAAKGKRSFGTPRPILGFVELTEVIRMHEVLIVSYCDRAVSVVRRPSCVVRRQLFNLCTL